VRTAGVVVPECDRKIAREPSRRRGAEAD